MTMTDLAKGRAAQPDRRTPTFAFHMQQWKRRVFNRFFPSRRFTYLPIRVSDEDFLRVWVPRIKAAKGAEIFVWGQNYPNSLVDFVAASGTPCYFIEDGFLRSNQPNAARIPPLSLCFDRSRAYFDSRGGSDLERLLETYDFDREPDLLSRAQAGIGAILDGRLSKYNSVNALTLGDLVGEKTRTRVLVIGQVEDDASIRFGCDRAVTNNDLVRLAAHENPQAQIIYKPHPDVLSGMRPAQSDPVDVEHLCYIMRENVPLAQSFDGVDKVYAITSLGGFEALMRGIPLVVMGSPFYAGWGLTDDRQPNARRTAKRSVEEVFAAAYILYSRYFDPVTGQEITFEGAIEWLKARLNRPELYRDEFVEFAPPKWAPWGAYGVMGWRLLLPFFVTPILGRIGNEKDVRDYRRNPIAYFRDFTSPTLRFVGRILYPFDPRR